MDFFKFLRASACFPPHGNIETSNPLENCLGALGVSCFRLVNEWDRLIVLRLGKFHEIKKPGLVFLLPVVDRIAARIDTRVQVSPFEAQETLTRDTVPVDVDAVLFWYVFDVKKASLLPCS
jgi:regulator of protease activity HflC (stomatin/prohibitin superfamily)